MGNCPTMYDDVEYAINMLITTMFSEYDNNNTINITNQHNNLAISSEINNITQKPSIIINNSVIENEDKLDILIHNFTPTNFKSDLAKSLENMNPDYITNYDKEINDDFIFIDSVV